MDDNPLEAYLAAVDEPLRAMTIELDAVIRAAAPELAPRAWYRMLTYAVGRDISHWVCALDARSGKVRLRFLHGAQLDAPRGLLRPGSTTMGTAEYRKPEQIDRAVVTRLVQEAVRRLPEFTGMPR